MPSLERHKHLRVLKLRGNKIVNIFGISQNAKLEILDLSENQL